MPFPHPPHWQSLVHSLYPTGTISRTKFNDNLIREMSNYIYIYFFFFLNFTCLLWLCRVFIATWTLSGCNKRGSSLIVVHRLLIPGLLLLWSVGTRCFGSYGGHAQLLQVGSSQTKDQTCVSCIGRQILYP